MATLENGQWKNIADPTDAQDAMTMNSAMSTAAGIPRVWLSGVKKSTVLEYYASATVASGTVTFWLTDNGLSTGNAVFTNVYLESLNLIVYSATVQYQFSAPTVASNKKSIAVTIGQLGTVILGIVQFISAANGITVYLQVKGD